MYFIGNNDAQTQVHLSQKETLLRDCMLYDFFFLHLFQFEDKWYQNLAVLR